MYATISRSDDDLTVGFGWTAPQSQSTEWWSVALLRSATQDGTYSSYRSTTRPKPGSVSFNDVSQGKWYMASVTGCDDDDVCASVNSSKLEVPTPTPTPVTPTPTPSGSLSAPVTISQFATTSVTASNLSPAGTSFKIAYPDTIREGTTCGSGGGTKLSGSTLYTITFNAMTSFVFKGCNLGLHVLRLLESTATGGSGMATTTINVVTPTPTPQPTDPPTQPTPAPPTVDIATVVPGWNSALFKVNYAANSTSTTVKEVKLSWKQNTGNVCKIIPFACTGGVKLGAQGVYKLDRFEQDSVYTFTATMKVSMISGGKTTERTFKDTYANVRTLSTPDLTVYGPDDYGSSLVAFGSFRGYLMNVYRLFHGIKGLTHSHVLFVENPVGTGLQIVSDFNSSCDWASTMSGYNLRDADAASLVPISRQIPQNGIFLARCDMGDGKTKLKIKAQAKVGDAKYDLNDFSVVVKRAWHQADHTVRYVLGNSPLTPTPTPAASSTPTPGPIALPTPNVPAGIATAAATWNGLSATTTVRLCEDGLCGNNNADGKIVTIDFVTPIPTPLGAATSSQPTSPCGHGILACVLGVQFEQDTHITNKIMYVPYPLHLSKKQRENVIYEKFTWTDQLDLAKSSRKYKYLPGVLLHEFGHTAGLGHNRRQGHAMHPVNSGWNGLTELDVKAMRWLYKDHSPNHSTE